MPRLLAFDLIRETDQEFQNRSGWQYRSTSPVMLPDTIIVQPSN